MLVDDLDSDALKHYVKIWADPYKFVGETKGGSITPCYTKLFITSNYTIAAECIKEPNYGYNKYGDSPRRCNSTGG